MTIRVLLADDHTVVREGLRFLPKVQGDMIVVGDAGDGYQAVDQVQKLRPDVVVVDIAMQKLNGIEATHQIRRSCPSTQVVILSIYFSARLPKRRTRWRVSANGKERFCNSLWMVSQTKKSQIDSIFLPKVLRPIETD